MTNPVAISVLGAGLIGARHVEHVAANPEARLHSVVDPTEAGRKVAEAHGAPWFPDFASMLAAGRPDGVVIATPNTLHVPHGLMAVEAGLPALVEKPFADTVAEGKKLVDAAARAGVPLLTGHHRRHNPMVGKAKEIIASGKLGKLVAIHAFFWILKPDDYFNVAWRRKAGAGPTLINLIHDLDMLRHLCGEIETVQALTSNAVRGFEVEDSIVLTLRFANGALGTINISDTITAPWSWEHTASEHDVLPRTDQVFMYIGGTHGSLSIPRLEVWSNAEKRGWWEPFRTERYLAAEHDPLRLQITQFVRVIRGEEAPLVSGLDGLKSLKALEAVREAAASGQTVHFDPNP